MKKKILLILLLLIMPVMLLCGCGNHIQGSNVGDEYYLGKLIFVKVEQSGSLFILVDKETRVMYLCDREVYQGGLTVMLNADGTPMLWEGELE